jgi:integral membrane protein (TIGR00529 family)
LGLIDPLTALVASLGALVLMLIKRVRLGVALNATAMILALLSINVEDVPRVLYSSVDPLTIDGQLVLSITITSFGIMLLSQLYKDSGAMDSLNKSLKEVLRKPKAILTVIPAVIGLLPVAGGALMSAPVVDAVGDELRLSRPKKVYVNLWFRHLIFLTYPLSPQFIIAVALTGMTSTALLSIVIPVVVLMAAIGYLASFRGVKEPSKERGPLRRALGFGSFLRAFSPIAVSIAGALVLGFLSHELSKRGLDVLIAVVMGLATLAATGVTAKSLLNALRGPTIYDITLATFGAFLLRNVVSASGLSGALKSLVPSGSPGLLLVAAVSTLCGFCLGSASGGLAVSISVLKDVMNFSFREAALAYMAACLGYIISPLHLCLLFTVDYFKADLKEVYKVTLPSFAVSLAITAMLFALI